MNANAPLTRFANESWRTALGMHSRVVGALIMRDLQTRFGSSYLGFFFGLVMPLGHLGIAVVVMSAIGQSAPIGQSMMTFLTTGIMPFVIWIYCNRQMVMAVLQNRPLMYFPGVDMFDILCGRAVVEVANATLVVVIVFAVLALVSTDVVPNDILGFLYAMILSWALGLATGALFGVLGLIWPIATRMGMLLGPLFWITCGIIYVPDSMPQVMQDILRFFPLTQIVESARLSFFPEYTSHFFSEKWMYGELLAVFGVGFIAIATVRRVA